MSHTSLFWRWQMMLTFVFALHSVLYAICKTSHAHTLAHAPTGKEIQNNPSNQWNQSPSCSYVWSVIRINRRRGIKNTFCGGHALRNAPTSAKSKTSPRQRTQHCIRGKQETQQRTEQTTERLARWREIHRKWRFLPGHRVNSALKTMLPNWRKSLRVGRWPPLVGWVSTAASMVCSPRIQNGQWNDSHVFEFVDANFGIRTSQCHKMVMAVPCQRE